MYHAWVYRCNCCAKEQEVSDKNSLPLCCNNEPMTKGYEVYDEEWKVEAAKPKPIEDDPGGYTEYFLPYGKSDGARAITTATGTSYRFPNRLKVKWGDYA